MFVFEVKVGHTYKNKYLIKKYLPKVPTYYKKCKLQFYLTCGLKFLSLSVGL